MPRPPQQSFTCSPSRPPSTAAAISPAICPGSGILPADSVRELSTTATLTPLTIPTGAPDPRYRPTARTAEFVRWRDLTCRWPGCDAPVERCDIDHTVPYPAGATHPSDLKHYCRTHRVQKAFMAGECFSERYGDVTAKRCHSPGTPLSL
jgi:hypothetical protein